MGEISDAKVNLVRGLIEKAPDAAVRSLLLALSADRGHDEALTRVQRIVEAESADRQARNLVFAPIAPLCGPPGAFSELTFPPRTLGALWRALKQSAPEEVADAKASADKWRGEERGPEALDALCALAAEALRSGVPEFRAAAEAADAGAGRDVLIACLDIAPIVRGALGHMPEWLTRMTGEKAAKLRLAYRDAAEVSADAGPRFFEMLAAHLSEPWLIMRVISGAMDKPSDAYMAASEVRGFGERVLADIDHQLDELEGLARSSGRGSAQAAARAVHQAVTEIKEVEISVTLSAGGPWGKRLAEQKRKLADTIESQLKSCERAVTLALPTRSVRVGQRRIRAVPELTADPDPALVEAAATRLAFLSEVRGSASDGGFASTRAKVQEAVDERLDAYVEELLEEIRADEGVDQARARAYLGIAADFCGLIRDEKAAQIVRRRAAAAASAA
ncbi:MAG TPA: hypothetical protein VMU37_08070 [Caulobacteraceae bacterium]|nr:hypothetical protein [Caulobacteraceae bacterium]